MFVWETSYRSHLGLFVSVRVRLDKKSATTLHKWFQCLRQEFLSGCSVPVARTRSDGVAMWSARVSFPFFLVS